LRHMSTLAAVLGSIRASALVRPDARVLAMVSGGADSVCLLHALRELLGPERVGALHVNHGLRAAAGVDERFCVELCHRLGVPLDVARVDVEPGGNLEANARAARYEAAERSRERGRFDRIATGHTATDQLETVIYRLVSSPGRRALMGIAEQSGRLIRPLLAVTREQSRAYCEEAGLRWREDESNLDRSFARNRIRLDVLPSLMKIHPAAERNVLATVAELKDEGELLDAEVSDAAARLATAGPSPALDGKRLDELPAPLRRLLLRRLGEAAARGPLALSGSQVGAIERLATQPGSATLDLGGGVYVTLEYGVLRFHRGERERDPEPAGLTVPGSCRFGDWDLACELEPVNGTLSTRDLGSSDEPLLDAERLDRELVVRPWREGDRMRPLGLAGTKSLQDLFVDRKVPRSLRGRLPVVESGGEIAWVAGVAVSELFKVTEGTARGARLRARMTLDLSQ
jgi:tRNA(Ile)-lysidine synthase